MAAVIGSRDNYNRDPNKMGKGLNNEADIFLGFDEGGSTRAGNSTQFWKSGFWTASLTSAQVGNTYRTIVDLSGKKGFLTCACGAMTGAGPVTFKITVDGVATEVYFPSMSPNSGQRAMLGWWQSNQSPNEMMSGTSGASSWTAAGGDGAILYNSTQPFHKYIVDPNVAVSVAPSGCVRFETSLKVEYKQLFAVSYSIQSFTGAMYKLDSA
jgi:hypothetical protein